MEDFLVNYFSDSSEISFDNEINNKNDMNKSLKYLVTCIHEKFNFNQECSLHLENDIYYNLNKYTLNDIDILKTILLDNELCINWEDISRTILTQEFIINFKDYLDWHILNNQFQCKYYPKEFFTEYFINQTYDKLSLSIIMITFSFDEEFIKNISEKINIIDEYGEIWNCISHNQNLSEDFIREFQNNVGWYCISEYQKLSEDFIIEFQNKIIWFIISRSQVLSEKFIKKFQDKLDWDDISQYQKLSEKFIWKFIDKVNLINIIKYQELSEEFIQNYYIESNVKLRIILKNNKIFFSKKYLLEKFKYTNKSLKKESIKKIYIYKIFEKFKLPNDLIPIIYKFIYK
jgi:hypothetical protein